MAKATRSPVIGDDTAPASPPAPSSAPAAGGARQAPPSDAAAGARAADAWRTALSAWLQDHESYPDAARRQGTEGRVVVRFTVDRRGHVGAASVVGGSGAPVLDDAAMALLTGATLPPFPAGMAGDRVTISVPLRYRLAP